MTLQLLNSEFPYIWGKFDFLFYLCTYNILRQPLYAQWDSAFTESPQSNKTSFCVYWLYAK
jgi:hypothetical protein